MYEEDRALVARMRAGDQRAFDEFVNASAPRLMAFVARRSALDTASLEDVVQCALIKAVRNLASYRCEAALFTWLTEICRHELVDVQRKAARRPKQLSLDESAATRLAVTQLRVPEHQEPAAALDAGMRAAAPACFPVATGRRTPPAARRLPRRGSEAYQARQRGLPGEAGVISRPASTGLTDLRCGGYSYQSLNQLGPSAIVDHSHPAAYGTR